MSFQLIIKVEHRVKLVPSTYKFIMDGGMFRNTIHLNLLRKLGKKSHLSDFLTASQRMG